MITNDLPQRRNIEHFREYFYQDINDVLHLYVEDTSKGYDKIYHLIFSRIFSEKFSNIKIEAIGSRQLVLKKYESILKENKAPYSPSLCVIDGDLYLLTKNENCHKGLYILPMYCIENLLLRTNEDSIIEFLNTNSSKIEDFSSKLKIHEFNSMILSLLVPLYESFAIAFSLNELKEIEGPHPSLISDSLERIKNKELCGEGIYYKLSGNKVDKLRNEIEDLYKNCPSYSTIKSSIAKKIHEDSDKLRFISGKDHLFPLFLEKLKYVGDCSIDKLKFLRYLAQKCDVKQISSCERFILMEE